jgi:hypothetical protein
MLERPRIVKEGELETAEDEEEEEDEELPSYLREQSSDEEDAALYSKNKLTANGASCMHCSTINYHLLRITLYHTPLYQCL